ncbi:MAG: hypothetical protein HY736_15365 [Verrucomicrobia bacterium]|nr:hypothetical protein [Verrucomicrobiota bacterium]
MTLLGPVAAILLGHLGSSAAWSAEGLGGTYTLPGTNGTITLVLQQDAAGKVTGSLKGGDLAAVLKGTSQPGGGVFGAATSEQGQFMAYFRAARQGSQLWFDLIEANANGAPNMSAMKRISFPVGGTSDPATASPATSTGIATGSAGFAGTFKGDGLSIESRAATGGYGGTMKMGEQSFPFTARAMGDALTGTFESKDGKFEFTATLRGTTLTLVTGGTTYTLAKEIPLARDRPPAANPLARSGSARAASPTGAAPLDAGAQPQGGPGGGSDWKVHKHPTGLSMRYPPDWTLNQTQSAAQLVPPDVASNAAGATEAYLVLGEGAQGVTSVEDPRVVQYYSQQMAQMWPFLRLTGQPERIRAGAAPGIVLTWEGTSPIGMAVRAQVLATVLKGYAVAIVALGDKTRIAARDKTVREIFASFAAGAGERDPRVVGRWKFWSYSSSADGRYGTTTDRRFALQADGNCQWSSSGESSGSFKGTNSLGETTWTGGVAGQSDSGVSRGQWSAANGALYVLWNDGSTGEWKYEVRGAPGNRRLFLRGNKAEPDEWVEGN